MVDPRNSSPASSRPRRRGGWVPSLLAVLAIRVVSLYALLRLRWWILPRCHGDLERRAALVNDLVHRWGSRVVSVTQRFLRFELAIEGTPPPEGRFLVTATFRGGFDIPLLLAALPALNLKLVVERQLLPDRGFLAALGKHAGFCVLERRDEIEDLAALERFGGSMEPWRGSPCTFPVVEEDPTMEGERPSRWGGVEAIRRSSGLSILPVTIEAPPAGDGIRGLQKLGRAQLRVRVGKVVDSAEIDAEPRLAYSNLERSLREPRAG